MHNAVAMLPVAISKEEVLTLRMVCHIIQISNRSDTTCKLSIPLNVFHVFLKTGQNHLR